MSRHRTARVLVAAARKEKKMNLREVGEATREAAAITTFCIILIGAIFFGVLIYAGTIQ